MKNRYFVGNVVAIGILNSDVGPGTGDWRVPSQ